ncbi:MAG: hypothetical protein PHU25_14365 [Deltaproteobacteria bacterium]|nr:hypothetical protein [Deltaproteobacteria bacterium]
MRSRLAIVLCVALAAGCAAGHKPASLAEFEAEVGKGAARSQAEAEATRYLALARRAASDGDEEQTVRFAELGLIEARVAAAEARQAEARVRLDAAAKQGRALARDKERLEGLIDAEERARERARIRSHVEQVVDAERRKAAAEEELRGRADGEVEDARVEVGREMIARTEVELDALVARGAGEAELAPVRAALKTAGARLAVKDAAGVQEQAEDAGVSMREVRERLPGPKTADAMATSLREAGLEVSVDDIGIVVPLGDPFAKGALLSQAGQTSAKILGRALSIHPEARLIVLTSAAALSEKRAKAFASALEAAGVPAASITARGCGASSPIDALRPPAKGRRDRTAVVVVSVAPPQGSR